MSFLQHLQKGLSIQTNPITTTSRTSTERNPTVSELRVFANGAVYPSASLVKKFNLEYTNEGQAAGNGFDVIDSRAWVNTASSQYPFIMIYPISKNEAKVDLFGTTRYNEDGTPMAKVMEQGTASFGKKFLIPMLKQVYGTEIPVGGYVDLDIVEATELNAQLAEATHGIYLIPKTTSRGDNKGAPSYIKRENLTMYVLVPHSLNTTTELSNTVVASETNNVGVITK